MNTVNNLVAAKIPGFAVPDKRFERFFYIMYVLHTMQITDYQTIALLKIFI